MEPGGLSRWPWLAAGAAGGDRRQRVGRRGGAEARSGHLRASGPSGVPRQSSRWLADRLLPRFWKLEPGDRTSRSTVLGRLTNGEPFLVEKPTGRGRAILAAVPMDNSWRTNLPVLPDFVRLVHELSYDLAGSRSVVQVPPGEPLIYQPAVEEPPGPVRIIRPMTVPRCFP